MNIAVNKKPIIIVAALVVIALVGYLVYFNFFTFNVKSTSPNSNSVSAKAPVLRIVTNRTISDKKIEIDDGSAGIVASVEHNDTTVVVNLYQKLEVDKKYTVTLKNITSTDGYTIPSYTYTFTPKDNDAYLSTEDNAIILNRQNQKGAILSDPVLNATPIEGEAFVIKSSLDATPNGKGTVSIRVYIYLNRDDMANYDSAVEKYKAQVAAELSKIKGYSADKYKITYTVQTP